MNLLVVRTPFLVKSYKSPNHMLLKVHTNWVKDAAHVFMQHLAGFSSPRALAESGNLSGPTAIGRMNSTQFNPVVRMNTIDTGDVAECSFRDKRSLFLTREKPYQSRDITSQNKHTVHGMGL